MRPNRRMAPSCGGASHRLGDFVPLSHVVPGWVREACGLAVSVVALSLGRLLVVVVSLSSLFLRRPSSREPGRSAPVLRLARPLAMVEAASSRTTLLRCPSPLGCGHSCKPVGSRAADRSLEAKGPGPWPPRRARLLAGACPAKMVIEASPLAVELVKDLVGAKGPGRRRWATRRTGPSGCAPAASGSSSRGEAPRGPLLAGPRCWCPTRGHDVRAGWPRPVAESAASVAADWCEESLAGVGEQRLLASMKAWENI